MNKLLSLLLLVLITFSACQDERVDKEQQSSVTDLWQMDKNQHEDFMKTKYFPSYCDFLNREIDSENFVFVPYNCCDDFGDQLIAGDLNYDGVVDICDMRRLMRIFKNFDLDNDGMVTTSDADLKCKYCVTGQQECDVIEVGCVDITNCWTHCEGVIWAQLYWLANLEAGPVVTGAGVTHPFGLTKEDICKWNRCFDSNESECEQYHCVAGEIILEDH